MFISFCIPSSIPYSSTVFSPFCRYSNHLISVRRDTMNTGLRDPRTQGPGTYDFMVRTRDHCRLATVPCMGGHIYLLLLRNVATKVVRLGVTEDWGAQMKGEVKRPRLSTNFYHHRGVWWIIIIEHFCRSGKISAGQSGLCGNYLTCMDSSYISFRLYSHFAYFRCTSLILLTFCVTSPTKQNLLIFSIHDKIF